MKIKTLVFFVSTCISSSSFSLSIEEARHLLTRTGFGASPQEIAELRPLTREQAVDKIVNGLRTEPISKPPAFIDQPLPDYFSDKGSQTPELNAFSIARDREIYQLRAWWLDQMISTPSPMTERLVLFWHNHFVSKYSTTFVTKPHYDQLQLFRSAGTTNFATLLHRIVRDPTMLIFLNNDVNTKAKPNENLARELLELFSLGVDHYSQNDIRELAKILAGHGVDEKETWRYRFNPNEAVEGKKSLLGVTGDLSLDDAIDIILKNPQTAKFISSKFYRDFINTQENPSAIDKLASTLRTKHYELHPFLRELLLSEDFWTQKNRGALVKSPVEFIVGFVRTTGVWMPDLHVLDHYAQQLGQELLDPPDVAGWPGGLRWLSPQQVATRAQVIDRLWDAYDDAQRWQHSVGANDFILRFGAEDDGAHPPHYVIQVDGKDIYRGVATRSLNINLEGDSQVPLRPKPMWQFAAIPRDRLPKSIHNISVRFEKQRNQQQRNDQRRNEQQGNPDTCPSNGMADNSNDSCEHFYESYMFVSWIQIDGKRYGSQLAEQHFLSGDSCSDAVPLGMLYCSGTLKFDLQHTQALEKGIDPTIADINNPRGGINSLLEHGTTRMPLLMQPAARKQRTTDLVTELKPLNISPTELLLATAPLRANTGFTVKPQDDEMLSTLAQLRETTLDPAYNLK